MAAIVSWLLPAALFALLYFPTFTYLSVGIVSPYAKADIRRRLLAGYIDGMPVVAAWFGYVRSDSLFFLGAAALYLLFRDAVGGQSLGKLLAGLVVMNLETGRPCTWRESVKRNVFFVVPAANIVALFLETISIARDPQGQRLGDRLAHTQVVEGFGARDLAASFQRWWMSVLGELDRAGRKRRRQTAERLQGLAVGAPSKNSTTPVSSEYSAPTTTSPSR